MSTKSFTVELEVIYDPETGQGSLMLPGVSLSLRTGWLEMLADKRNAQQMKRRIVELEAQVEQKGGAS